MKLNPLIILLIVVLLLTAIFSVGKRLLSPLKISVFGKYRGFSEKIYDGTQRSSNYLTLSDGTRLAYDLILPTQKGQPAREPLPVLFKYTPYLRTFTIFDKNGRDIFSGLFKLGWKERAMLRVRYILYERGHLMDALFRTKWLEPLILHGYAVVVVERLGTGASFGVMDPSFEVGAREADEILNWIAAQPWCDGNIGMYGDSWQAQIQFAAAATGNPHLKAIFPASSSMDTYSAVIYPGGIYNQSFAGFFSWSTGFLENLATPVDSDPDGLLLAQARAEREQATVGAKSAEVMAQYPFRDSLTPSGKQIWRDDFALYPFIERINRAGVPVYMTNGWYDIFTRDMFLWYANLTVPKRLVVRPLDHSQIDANQFDLDYAVEAHRWFDYWLKGIDNGIMDEPPIHYYVMEGDKNGHWQASQVWPPSETSPTRFYFAASPAGSVDSANDGLLLIEPPAAETFDSYTVDYSATMGKKPRWTAVNWEMEYPDLRSNDAKALTYTAPPLEQPLTITGHPIVHLWLQATATDLDVFAYLEVVDAYGHSTYLTEGQLRASHRALDLNPPYDTFGLPYHSFYESNQVPIPENQPFEMVFDLLPTAYTFSIGNRIRITIAFADAGNFATPSLDPAPAVRLHHSSCIELPIQNLGSIEK
jgi:putative CocE/NonD family hydrolase